MIHSAASRLAKKLTFDYGVRVPESTGASILWRLTKAMGCTRKWIISPGNGEVDDEIIAVLYMMTKRLASMRSMALTLHGAIGPRLPTIKASDVMGHVYDYAAVEVQWMALLIIVLKVVYGLDE